jgi:branched-chain amino acid transport system ATP-binding protein
MASLEVSSGEIVAMIGPNVAGKSTCLRAIAGILPHYDGRIAAGEVRFEGRLINGLPPHKLIKHGLSLVPENRHVFASMTVEENLEMGGHTLRRGQESSIKERMEQMYALFPRLKERRKQRAGTLSTGEQQMLAMGRGLMIQPKLLLVDEPTVGLSPNFVDLVFDKLVEINKAGTSVLLVEQNARCALDICHRAYVFEIGRIAFSGPRDDLVNDERIKKAYLGS